VDDDEVLFHYVLDMDHSQADVVAMMVDVMMDEDHDFVDVVHLLGDVVVLGEYDVTHYYYIDDLVVMLD